MRYSDDSGTIFQNVSSGNSGFSASRDPFGTKESRLRILSPLLSLKFLIQFDIECCEYFEDEVLRIRQRIGTDILVILICVASL